MVADGEGGRICDRLALSLIADRSISDTLTILPRWVGLHHLRFAHWTAHSLRLVSRLLPRDVLTRTVVVSAARRRCASSGTRVTLLLGVHIARTLSGALPLGGGAAVCGGRLVTTQLHHLADGLLATWSRGALRRVVVVAF